MRDLLKRIIEEDGGLELVETAVMMALVVVLVVLAIIALSAAISGKFGSVVGLIEGKG